jgi:AP-1 complex subunit beta-1
VTSLPPVLLEQLLTELSTLASVYHKPPESFVGKGRYGADAIQRAAIQEQRQNLAENPIAASVAAAAAANGTGAPQSNIENLLDIDFDGAAPASAEHNTAGTGTPDRVASPAGGAPSGGMADIMGLFDAPSAGPSTQNPPPGMSDMMDGFAGMDLSGMSAPPPASQQLGQKPAEQKGGSEDLLGLF